MTKAKIVFNQDCEKFGITRGYLYELNMRGNVVMWKNVEIGEVSDGKFKSQIANLTGKVIKTKTLKCTGHIINVKIALDSFKVDKRYQVDMSRPVSGVAGVIFDEEGYPWLLTRVEVGFESACAKFEAKYF